MKSRSLWGVFLLLCTFVAPLTLAAQESVMAPAVTAAAQVVPNLINYNGILRDSSGRTLNSITGVTFLLYNAEQGGAPLWLETQNITPDESGHYAVQLGAATQNGIPAELFTNGEARWLAIQIGGEAEQPRTLLVAVPYAMKAADAQTLGGLPASAFALAAPTAASTARTPAIAPASAPASVIPNTTSDVTTTGGTAQHLAIFTKATNIQNSIATQVGTTAIDVTGKLGINTAAPAESLDVTSGNAIVRGAGNFLKAGNTATLYVGDTSHPIEAIWGSGLAIGTYKVPQAFFIQDKTGNVGIGTTTPTSGTLTTVATSASVVGLSATGWTQPETAGLGNTNGGDAIDVSGGNGYSPTGLFTCGVGGSNPCNGGAGLVVTGGMGSLSGPGVVANGGSTGLGPGGVGIDATGGGGTFGASGGSFMPGGGRYGGGDGIDAAAEEVAPSDAGFFTAEAGACATSDYCAGYFSGDVNVTGTIYAGTKDFRIDHPLDPGNKYLQHASVESSEMKNIYDGLVVLDGTGEAVVQLPSWFEAVNGDFRYQLTAIGQPSPGLYIAKEISNNSFQIAGGAPGAKVSWQVTGVRHDPYAKAHPLVIEPQKNALERGNYIHPELYGAPEERSITWARHPAFMKRVKEANAKHAAQRAAMETSAQPAAQTGAR
jgi:trimeric autotransporter adhesin